MLEQTVVTGILWAVFGLGAGTLFGLYEGRAVSARRLKAFRPLLPPDSSVVLAWAQGALTPETVAPWKTPESEQLILRFNQAPHGAVLKV